MAIGLVLGGATGLLGQALVQVLQQRGHRVETLGRTDGNLLDRTFLAERLHAHNFDFIFNAVAWTQVDAAEEHEAEALLFNKTLPELLALELQNQKGLLIHFSTDFVFPGEDRQLPYSEADSTQPKCAYGRTKLAGEQAIRNILPEKSLILRTAWLFGPGRANFVQTILSASQKRDVLKVVQDQCGSPTYTPDLAEWSIQLAEHKAVGIWHTVNSGQASWYELAVKALEIAGKKCRVQPIDSSQWPQKAQRPTYSVLNTAKLAAFLGHKPRSWLSALTEYLNKDHNLV